jgi:hypothetical protein
MIISLGGALFLLIFGIRSFLSAWNPKVLDDNSATKSPTSNLRTVVWTLLAFSLLNPHVYLDTVLLLGSIGARHPQEQRFSFIMGASTASILWFFGLSYGSSILTPLLKKESDLADPGLCRRLDHALYRLENDSICAWISYCLKLAINLEMTVHRELIKDESREFFLPFYQHDIFMNYSALG